MQTLKRNQTDGIGKVVRTAVRRSRWIRAVTLPCGVLGFGFSAAANAWDWQVAGRVIAIEGSYAPNSVPFMLDVAGGSCPVGNFLAFLGQGGDTASKAASVQQVTALLLTARAAGLNVRVFGTNAGCVANYVWLE